MKRVICLVICFVMLGTLGAPASPTQEVVYLAMVSVKVHTTWDAKEIKFISLRDPKGNEVLLSGDKDLELVKQLLRLNGGKVLLTLETF